MINLKIIVLDMTITGGVERVASNMALYFSKQIEKFSVEIISIFKRNNDIPYPIPPNVKVRYLCTTDYYKLDSVQKKLKSNFLILRALSRLSFSTSDVVVSNMANISDMLALLKFRNKGKLICFEHTYHKVFGLFSRLVKRVLFNRADCIVTLTESEKVEYQKHFQNVVCIPNALTFFPASSAKYNSKRVIAVGRLSQEKGFMNLLPTYISLARKYSDWDFVIFGSGSLEVLIRKGLQGAPHNVKLYPSTPRIKDEMLNSSIYVCSSETEAFPMVMLEAMACGLPVITYDCPSGPREIVHHKIDGELIPMNNCLEYEKAIECLIDDEKMWARYSFSAKSNVKRFLPEMIFHKWVELINSLYQ